MWLCALHCFWQSVALWWRTRLFYLLFWCLEDEIKRLITCRKPILASLCREKILLFGSNRQNVVCMRGVLGLKDSWAVALACFWLNLISALLPFRVLCVCFASLLTISVFFFNCCHALFCQSSYNKYFFPLLPCSVLPVFLQEVLQVPAKLASSNLWPMQGLHCLPPT
jgi:hypothetical protein